MITSFNVFVPSLMGKGSSKRIGMMMREKGYKKAFVVYDKGVWEVGIVPTIIENINVVGIETVCFDGVLPDPPDVLVEEAAKMACAAGCDVIVGVGGGSAIDTAKGVNVLINNPPPLKQWLGIQKGLKSGLPMIFVPTTAGTGSEVTNMTVVTVTSENRKDSVISPVCQGTLAILDPDLTMGLPPKMTATTGFDALAHALECMTGGDANPLSDALAREVIRSIRKWLPIAVADGKNEIAREKMIEASMFAGMAFTNALVHLGHVIGHAIGARFHVAHGDACAVCMPEVIEWTARSEIEKVRDICECMGATVPEDATWQEVGAIAREAIRSFLKEIGLPANIQELGLSLEEVLTIVPLVNADNGMCVNPYRITKSEVEALLKAAYDA